MPQRWIVEHTDSSGIINVFHYEHLDAAKDVADQTWEEYKDQPGHAVKVYRQADPGTSRELVYTVGSAMTQ
jgi:hypothetical protein